MRTLNKITLERMEEYIKKYSMEKGISPSYRNIMHSLGMSSLNLVQRYYWNISIVASSTF